MEFKYVSSDALLFIVWWMGYSVALHFYFDKKMPITPEKVAIVAIKSILWFVAIPVSLVTKMFRGKQQEAK